MLHAKIMHKIIRYTTDKKLLWEKPSVAALGKEKIQSMYLNKKFNYLEIFFIIMISNLN